MTRDRQSVKRRTPPNQDPQRLRRRRLAARLGVIELANKAGINPGYLSQLEYGKYSASADKLADLAGVLDCKVTDLMPRDVLSRARGGQYNDPRLLGAIADALGLTVEDVLPPDADDSIPADPNPAAQPEQRAA